MGLRWDRDWYEQEGVVQYQQQEPPPAPRCERKRVYPLGDNNDCCLNRATHVLVVKTGKESRACPMCAETFVAQMAPHEEITIIRLAR